jgi:hypothetical protein
MTIRIMSKTKIRADPLGGRAQRDDFSYPDEEEQKAVQQRGLPVTLLATRVPNVK